MAIGFIKKIFSFGKGAVEEKPAAPHEAPEAAIAEAVTPPSVPSEDLPDEPRAVEATAEDDRRAIEDAEAGAAEITPSAESAADEVDARSEKVEANTETAADENVAIEDESAPPPISPPVGEMPGRAEGGGSDSGHAEVSDSETDLAADMAAIPPSVPLGHLPHKGGEQKVAGATAEDDRTAIGETKASTDDLATSPELTARETDITDDVGALPGLTKEDSTREGAAVDENATVGEERAAPPISPLLGEMSGRAERGEAAEPMLSAAPALPKGFAIFDQRPKEGAPALQPKLNWYQRLRRGLARTSSQLTGQIASLFTKRKLDEATLQDLEDLLIQADLGVETAMRITDTLASERYGKDVSGEDVSRIMAGEITKVLAPVAKPLELDLSHKPHVILVVGVNGTGKTTTIGKLAAKLSGAGLKVMLAAGDTFRAAAIEQLKIWAERTKSDIVSSMLGADAAGLAYEAFQLAREKKSDVLIIDTAGRLQNKTELMAELEKIVRVLGKLDPDAPHTVLQTLDATTGQNALQQVEIFRNVAGVSGLIMTKLDGTARGGILVAISAKHKLPVYFIGVGEGVDDLEPFEAKDFAEAIAGVAA
ncbi:signal recognition particle-docking protein FtsY [Sinorhizobium sp. 8-89]|uniref:signal recognition particle-docking protein FtsY n=1 Tax=Sinorhizobium sp. 7-81 TaxID=3049087 RepID=UPI0024C30CAB|nr:signal recognition particle-docking protein FtsY [Sinorhizobium sp. 7-81]MDK1387496.1 signal recognition particle-docking protein FtsY [Sinorhizobium sp. 7-81]